MTIKTERTEYIVYHTSNEDDFWFYGEPGTFEECELFCKTQQEVNPDRTYKIVQRIITEQDIKEYPGKNREKKLH